MGLDSYSSLSTANSTTSKAECTQRYNASYSHYTSNDNRKKFAMDANGNITTTTSWYWGRSRYYSNTTYVCGVDTNGSANAGGYTYTGGCLAPAFVIG